MTSSLVPPRTAAQIGQTKGRVSDLERRLQRPLPGQIGYIAKFSLHGALRASTSGCDLHPTGGRLSLVYAILDVVGTTTTVVNLLKNGTTFATIKLTPNNAYNELVVSQSFSARRDEFQVAIVTAGVGAKTLTVFGQFDP